MNISRIESVLYKRGNVSLEHINYENADEYDLDYSDGHCSDTFPPHAEGWYFVEEMGELHGPADSKKAACRAAINFLRTQRDGPSNESPSLHALRLEREAARDAFLAELEDYFTSRARWQESRRAA